MIIQTIAIFHDAYRDLADRKLFWITLILSAVAMLGFAGFHADDQALTYFGFKFPDLSIPSRILYKHFFSSFVIGFWLTFVSAILALISTASIFPDLVSGGSIDLFLSKPISRLRLFFTKYLAGLLFVFIQVSLFITLAFFVLGIRSGSWKPALFWGIPIVVCFFSYLFAICVFIGVFWRSTLTAIFLTLLFWGICYSLSLTELILLNVRTDAELTLNRLNMQVDTYDKRIARMQPTSQPGQPPSTQPEPRLLADFKATRERLAAEQHESVSSVATWKRWHGIFFSVKSFLPKTTETIALLDRILVSREETAELMPEHHGKSTSKPVHDEFEPPRARPEIETQNKLRDRSVSWIVGTSLLFEAVVLSLAAWIFQRRDF
ncbi:MAG TPA: hypothetical protein VGQ99_07450 [Tepidisphaeraceae bacterium]|jgi:ABC-type transport system involved in multi-copper enzyme maturation permease subunit|nr:hypothetical protein [Tepidisphaeraceae bacterium]HEV8605185.1 hypothetical protein [Tepidisphaeraceae bacterium]